MEVIEGATVAAQKWFRAFQLGRSDVYDIQLAHDFSKKMAISKLLQEQDRLDVQLLSFAFTEQKGWLIRRNARQISTCHGHDSVGVLSGAAE